MLRQRVSVSGHREAGGVEGGAPCLLGGDGGEGREEGEGNGDGEPKRHGEWVETGAGRERECLDRKTSSPDERREQSYVSTGLQPNH